MNDVTDLDEWRQRRAILDMAEKVEAMARALGAASTDQAAPSRGDSGDADSDLPF